jgi:hypothetical protein
LFDLRWPARELASSRIRRLVTRRVPQTLLLWCLFWLLLPPVCMAQAGESPVLGAEIAAAELQAPDPGDGLADDEEDFAPPQEIYARTNHREGLSVDGGGGQALALPACSDLCPVLQRFREAERHGAVNAGFHVRRTLHPRAPPAA